MSQVPYQALGLRTHHLFDPPNGMHHLFDPLNPPNGMHHLFIYLLITSKEDGPFLYIIFYDNLTLKQLREND